MTLRVDESYLLGINSIFLWPDNPSKTDEDIICLQSPSQHAKRGYLAETARYKTHGTAAKTDLDLPSQGESRDCPIFIWETIEQDYTYMMVGSSGYIRPVVESRHLRQSEGILDVCGVQILRRATGQTYVDPLIGSLDWYPDQIEDSLEQARQAIAEEIEDEALESLLIANMSQIPEVESIYKYQEEEYTTYFTILNTTKYQREVHMQVYEVEYNLGRKFPEANIGFECVPKLALDDNLLPVGIGKIYERESML